MVKLKGYFLFVCYLLISFTSKASHLLGGEITWKCVNVGSIQKYKFTVIVFRDCSGCVSCLSATDELKVWNMSGVLSTTRNVGLLNTPSTTNQSIKLTRVIQRNITPACSFPTSDPLNCATGEKGAIEKHVYETGLIDFFGIAPPSNPNSPIRFTWEQNARNVSNNIYGGSMVLISNMYPYYPNGSIFAKSIVNCFDNAPNFSENPAPILYSNSQQFNFNNNAIDIDLDDISYELEDPIINLINIETRQTPSEIWSNYPVINKNNPFGLATSNYSFNSKTGEFKFKPINLGAFNFVTKAVSYKQNQKVSEVFRDFQILILANTTAQSANRFPTIYPFNSSSNPNLIEITAGNKLKIPIIIRDSLPLSGSGLSSQSLELTVNGIAMGLQDADTLLGCPFPPCAMLSKKKNNFTYNLTDNTKPVAIQNVSGEIFGYGFNFSPQYNDTVWLYWPTSCSNSKALDSLNSLNPRIFNFVVSAKDNFCRVPAKTIQTISVKLLSPQNYLSPKIKCITFDQVAKNVILKWGVSTGDTNTFVRYEIFRDNIKIYSTTNRKQYEYIDFNPPRGDSSEYYVRSINFCGIEDYVFPVTPMRLFVSLETKNQAKLTWNSNSNINDTSKYYYSVFRSRNNNPHVWVPIVDADLDSINNVAIDNFSFCNDTTYYKVEKYSYSSCNSISTIDTVLYTKSIARFHSDTVCIGAPTNIYLDTLYGAFPIVSYNWLGKEGLNAGMDDTISYIYPSPGTKHFVLTVIDAKGCRTDISDSVWVRSLPVVKLAYDSACSGAIINLRALVSPTTPHIKFYEWTGDNGLMSLTYDSLNLINPAQWIFASDGGGGLGRGKFGVQLRVIDVYGCESILKDTIEINEPNVEILGDTSMLLSQMDTIKFTSKFLTKPFNTVQWFDNATGSIIYQGGYELPVTKLAGRLYVDLRLDIEDSKGCSGSGRKSFNLATGINNLDQNNFTFYPNPVTSKLYFSKNLIANNFVFSVYDINGKCLIYNENLNDGKFIDFSLFSKGVYILKCDNRILKIVKL